MYPHLLTRVAVWLLSTPPLPEGALEAAVTVPLALAAPVALTLALAPWRTT